MKLAPYKFYITPVTDKHLALDSTVVHCKRIRSSDQYKSLLEPIPKKSKKAKIAYYLIHAINNLNIEGVTTERVLIEAIVHSATEDNLAIVKGLEPLSLIIVTKGDKNENLN